VETYFVRAVFDLDCTWTGQPPSYRIYINDEMFTEKTWAWPSHLCLEQILQIQAPIGKYVVTVEPIGNPQAEFVTRNHRIEYGSARWQKTHKIIIEP